MLLKLLKRWYSGKAADPSARTPDAALLERAQECMLAGDNQGAIRNYRDYLETDPYNVSALNDMGACLVDSGDIAAGVAALERAYTLDDTSVPVMVNYAKLLNDHYKRGEDALRLLRRAKLTQPDFSHADAVYAGVCFKRGEGATATRFQLKAWLANFDNLRLANGVMFWGSYDATEEHIAAEHRFWGETLKPLDASADISPAERERAGGGELAGAQAAHAADAAREEPARSTGPLQATRPARRVRIGYWSPDFRGHSVRFFFRPLLENHEREKFEVVLFHDCPLPDEQTKLIEAAAEHFHDVHEMPDGKLREFIRAQQLDVLVDLAGHTSFNRLSQFQERLASVQVNALGYPPTTGLRSMDAKVIDRHVATPADAGFYTEQPMVLDGSFWCYDPMEEVPEPVAPPLQRNGHVTFGCVGNIAKITQPVLAAWKAILARVPTARLLIRAINFEDAIALDAMRATLAAAGIEAARVDLVPPKGGADFYTSYNEIDVILDTFPFNGGTTTCFATYMGVPVVTLAGASLVSRMGLSIMTNLGAPEYAVRSLDEYIARAVAAAEEPEGLAAFRAAARDRYRASALGNGALFTRDFESACMRLLKARRDGAAAHEPRLPALAEAEIMRRAYAVVRRGQVEAAERVAEFCLRCYPDSGKPHLLKAQLLIWGEAHAEAVAYLDARLGAFSEADRTSALLVIARVHLLLEDFGAARAVLARIRALDPKDPFDRMQVDFYESCVVAQDAAAATLGASATATATATATASGFDRPGTRAPSASNAPEFVLVVVPCDDAVRFEAVRAQLAAACAVPPGWHVDVRRCAEAERIGAYESALADDTATIVVFMQKNVAVHSTTFLVDVAATLREAGLAGCAGARRWERLDWRLDDFAQKTGSFIAPSSERKGGAEVHWFGAGRSARETGLAVLDGNMLAVRAGAGELPPFDEKLLSAGTLLEEAWSHACAKQGRLLAVHRGLGVFIDSGVAIDESDRTEARVSYAIERSFDPFAHETDDYLSVSAPTANAEAAVAICRSYLAAH